MNYDEKTVNDRDMLLQVSEAAAADDGRRIRPITDVLFAAVPPEPKNARFVRGLGFSQEKPRDKAADRGQSLWAAARLN